MFKHIFLILLITLSSCNSKITKEECIYDNYQDTLSSNDSLKLEFNEEPDFITPKGTQILAKSKKTMYSNELSPYFLSKVSLSDCNESTVNPDYEKHHQVQSISWTDSTLIIDFSFIATCGSDFLCEVEMVDKNTLNLIYHQYNSLAMCNCCYGLKYTFHIHEYFEPDFHDKVDDLPKIKFVSFNGEKKVKLK